MWLSIESCVYVFFAVAKLFVWMCVLLESNKLSGDNGGDEGNDDDADISYGDDVDDDNAVETGICSFEVIVM